MDYKYIPVESVQERDIDLLIIEHKKSLSFRVKCYELDRTKSFNLQVKKVVNVFGELIKLENWIFNNIKF